MIYVKAVQEVLSGRDHLQAGGLPVTAGPSSGRRPSLAVCPRSVSKTLAGGKRKGLDEEQQAAAQLPANKRARGQSTGSVPAPTPPRSSKQRGKKVLWHRPGEVLSLSNTLSLLRACFTFSFSVEGKGVEGYKVQRQRGARIPKRISFH